MLRYLVIVNKDPSAAVFKARSTLFHKTLSVPRSQATINNKERQGGLID